MITLRETLAPTKLVTGTITVIASTKVTNVSWAFDIGASADDLPGKFRVFVRVNKNLPDNFSIGLGYEHGKKVRGVCLARVNGDHGEHSNPDGTKLTGGHVHFPRQDEMDDPLISGYEPKYADPLPPTYLDYIHAWKKLCALAHIESSPRIEEWMADLAGNVRQADLGDLLT